MIETLLTPMGDSTLEDVFEALAVDYLEGGKIEIFVHPPASFSRQSWDRESRKGRYIQHNPGEIIPNISFLRQTEQYNNARSGDKEPTKNSDSEDSEFSRSFPAGGSSNSDDSEEKKSPPETKRFHVQPLGNNSFALVGNSVQIRAHHKRTSRQLEYSTKELCPKCESIDLKELYDGAEAEHHSFNALSTSAETCKLCALMLGAAGEPETCVFDNAESIKLRGVRSKSGGSTHIPSKIPMLRGRFGEANPRWKG
jgi:hypothetical protein